MDLELGQFWRTSPSHQAWKIEKIFIKQGKKYVELSRNSSRKNIQVQHLRTSYILVGSDKEDKLIKEWMRHKWELASDVSSRSQA